MFPDIPDNVQNPQEHTPYPPQKAPPFPQALPQSQTPSSERREPDGVPAMQPDAAPSLRSPRRKRLAQNRERTSEQSPSFSLKTASVSRSSQASLPPPGDALPTIHTRMYLQARRRRHTTIFVVGSLAVLIAIVATLVLYGQREAQQQLVIARHHASQATATSIMQTHVAASATSAAIHATMATQTTTAIFAKTYSERVPGPCGGEGQWLMTGQYQCLPTGLRLLYTYTKVVDPPSVTFSTNVLQLPQFFIVSVDVMNLTSSNENPAVCINFGDNQHGQYLPYLYICNGGGLLSYSIYPDDLSGNLPRANSFRMTMQVSSNNVRFGIDGAWIYTGINPHLIVHTQGIEMELDISGTTASDTGSVDLKNFTFTPLQG